MRITYAKKAMARYNPVFDLKLEQLQYLAGIIDAEGTVQIDPHYAKYQISICNSDRRCLEWVLNTVHFGNIYSRGITRQNHFGSKEIFVWQCAVSDFTKRLLVLLLPYLRVKRSKALHILEQQTVPTEPMSWPYIAAFFDGEGCASFYEKEGLWVASLSNTEFAVLKEIQEFMGFGRIYSGAGTKKPIWTLRLSSHDIQLRFGQAVLPFLVIKGEKIRGMVNFIQGKEWDMDLNGGHKLAHVSIDELRRKYLDEHKSIQQLATEYNASYNPMREHLLKCGVPLRSSQEGTRLRHIGRYIFPKESVLSRYNGGESARALAKELGMDHHALCKWLRGNGVKVRPKLWKLHDVSSEELLMRYRDGWSVRQLAEQYSVSLPAMYTHLKKLGVVFSSEQKPTQDLVQVIEP